MRNCDVGLVSYNKYWPPCIPNKPIDYMGLGIPILSSIAGQLYEMVEEYNVGRNYISGNHKDLAQNIIWFQKNRDEIIDMGKNAYLLVKKHFLADNISEAYVDFLENVLNDSSKNNL